MIEFISSLFGFAGRLFSWMPSYLYSFVCSALNVAATVLAVIIGAKLISGGANLVKTIMGK